MSTRSLEIHVITLLVAVTILAGCCSTRPAHGVWSSSESMVIEPRVSVGPVRSGMTIQQVVAELGEPDRRLKVGVSEAGEQESALEYLNLGLSILAGKDGIVHNVACVDTGKDGPFKKAFAGRTKEGIGIGSSRADVIRAYGEPTAIKTIDGKPDYEALRYKPHGLVFELRDGKVDAIGVFFYRPRNDA
jgi:hypothetical protein